MEQPSLIVRGDSTWDEKMRNESKKNSMQGFLVLLLTFHRLVKEITEETSEEYMNKLYRYADHVKYDT